MVVLNFEKPSLDSFSSKCNRDVTSEFITKHKLQ